VVADLLFKVLRVDGPNLTTDQGGVSIQSFSYADGGKSRPVDLQTWRNMRALFMAGPGLLAAAQELLALPSVPLPAGLREDFEMAVAAYEGAAVGRGPTHVRG
jgi:hypothetical protein